MCEDCCLRLAQNDLLRVRSDVRVCIAPLDNSPASPARRPPPAGSPARSPGTRHALNALGESGVESGRRAANEGGRGRGRGLVTHVPTEAEEAREAARKELEAEREAEGAAERVREVMDGRQDRFDGQPYWEQVLVANELMT